jgi:hypothetical protein
MASIAFTTRFFFKVKIYWWSYDYGRKTSSKWDTVVFFILVKKPGLRLIYIYCLAENNAGIYFYFYGSISMSLKEKVGTLCSSPASDAIIIYYFR